MVLMVNRGQGQAWGCAKALERGQGAMSTHPALKAPHCMPCVGELCPGNSPSKGQHEALLWIVSNPSLDPQLSSHASCPGLSSFGVTVVPWLQLQWGVHGAAVHTACSECALHWVHREMLSP